jgi:hypothetical protein
LNKIPGMLATICWFHTLKMNLNVETIGAVQRLVEPVGDRELWAFAVGGEITRMVTINR